MRIPENVILIWTGTNASIPNGWTRETSLDGRFIKGWGVQNPNEVGGESSHTHSTQSHTHNISSHTHSCTIPYVPWVDYANEILSSGAIVEHYHYHTATTGGITEASNFGETSFTTGASSNEPPFKKVIFIKAGTSSILKENIIAFWTGWDGDTNPPTNWQECNGNNNSPDLRNKYLKGADTGEDAGGEGGSYYNTHSLNHNHTAASHKHTGYTTSYASGYRVRGKNNVNGGQRKDHTHTYGNTDSTSITPDEYTDNHYFGEVIEPEYKKVLAIQFKSGAIKVKGIIGLWLGSTSNIPKGWYLCDGQNNTPDLRDKFIKIANNSSEIGQTGGSNTHSHSNVSHYHTTPPHNHFQNETKNHNDAPKDEPEGSGNGDPLQSWGTHGTFYTDNTTVNTTNSDIIFNSADNQPPYRTIVFIQFQKEIYGGAVLTGLLN